MLVGVSPLFPPSLLLLFLIQGCEARDLIRNGPYEGRDLVRNGPSNSPFDQGLRSTLDLPLPDLIESPLSKYDPGPRDLNATELRLKLGTGFHQGFMSISQPPRNRMVRLDHREWWKGRRKEGSPRRHLQSTLQYPQQSHPNRSSSDGGRPSYPPWIADEARKMSTSGKRTRPSGGRNHLDGGSRTMRWRKKEKGASGRRRLVRRLLYSMTQCPIRWTWKDLGVRFWPRWIKEGRCGEAGGKGTRRRKKDGSDHPPGVRGSEDQGRTGTSTRGEESSGGEVDAADVASGGSHFRKVLSGTWMASYIGAEFNSGGRGRKEGGKKGLDRRGGKLRREKRRKEWRRKEVPSEEEVGVGRKGGKGLPPPMGASCSIPPGMVCRASYARTVTLLRWHCKERKDAEEGSAGSSSTKVTRTLNGKSTDSDEERKNCRWIKVEYPIVTRCACVCPD